MQRPCDLLLTGGTVLTMDPDGNLYPRGSIAVQDGNLLDIGPSMEVDPRWKARRVLDAAGRLLMPGFVNTHTHVAMAFARGLTGVPSLNPLYDVVWPLENLLRHDDIYPLARLGLAECLRSGTTTIADHYFYMEEIARACEDMGIRAVLGPTIMDLGGPLPQESTWPKALDFIGRWHGRNPLITPCLAPHATDTVSKDLMEKVVRTSGDSRLLLHIHLAQSQEEADTILQRHGTTPTQYLANLGALGPETLAAHAIYLEEADFHVLAPSGCWIAYCPSSHALTGKVAPAAKMIQKGIRVALGTDCAAFNNDMDMFEEVRTAVFCQNTLEGKPWAILADKALAMSTREGAQALGFGTITGSLEVGKRADFIVLRTNLPRFTPFHDTSAAALVVLCASESMVESVFVGGIEVIENGRLTVADEGEILERGRNAAGKVLERTKGKTLYRTLFEKL